MKITYQPVTPQCPPSDVIPLQREYRGDTLQCYPFCKREYHGNTLQCYPFANVSIMAALCARGEGCTTTNGPFSSYYQKSNPIQHQSNSFLTDWNPKPAVLTHPQLEYYLPQSNKKFQKHVSIGIIPIQYQKPFYSILTSSNGIVD